jgi:hypothetical protein
VSIGSHLLASCLEVFHLQRNEGLNKGLPDIPSEAIGLRVILDGGAYQVGKLEGYVVVLVQNIQGSLDEISSDLLSLSVQILDGDQRAPFDWLLSLVLSLRWIGSRRLLIGGLAVCLGSTALALALTLREEKRPIFAAKHALFIVQNIGDRTSQAVAHGTGIVVIVHRIMHRTSRLSQDHSKTALLQETPVERRNIAETVVFGALGTRSSLGRAGLNITRARRDPRRRTQECPGIAVFLCIINIVVATIQSLVVQLRVFETLSGQDG